MAAIVCRCQQCNDTVKLSFNNVSLAHNPDRFEKKDLDDFVCSICHWIAADTVQQPCGHVHCRNCLAQCPLDKRNGVVTDCPFLSNKVRGLTVVCAFKSRGCQHKGTLGLVTTVHENSECPFRHVACPHCHQYKIFTQCNQLLSHTAMDTCVKCKEMYHCKLRHTCAKCPNFQLGCLEFVSVPNLPAHLVCQEIASNKNKTCQKHVVKCDFVDIGCTVQMTRDTIVFHQADMALHFRIMSSCITQTRQELANTKLQLERSEKSVESLAEEVIELNTNLATLKSKMKGCRNVSRVIVLIRSTANAVSVWAHFDIPHTVKDQLFTIYGKFFTAFGRRYRLGLNRQQAFNEECRLYALLDIDPDQAISAVAPAVSLSADAYDSLDLFDISASICKSELPSLDSKNTECQHVLFVWPSSIGPLSHRVVFPSDQLVLHCRLAKLKRKCSHLEESDEESGDDDIEVVDNIEDVSA